MIRNRTTVPILLAAIAATLLVLPQARSSSVHAAAPPLPASRLEFGLANGPSDLGWMTSSGVPWKYRYQYLAGGVNTANPWPTWQDLSLPPGQFAVVYMNNSQANGYIPVFTYYEVLQSNPSTGANESDRDYSNLNNTTTMNSYYANFKLLMQKAGAFGHMVVVHVEPDLWGYLQQRAGSGDASTVSASVASSGFADVAAIPNTVQGFAWALLHIRDLYAGNVVLAIHASPWSNGGDIASSTSSSMNVVTIADATAAFLSSAGISSNPFGSTWDVVFNDLDDHDAGWWETQGRNHWWDPTNATFPNFTRYLAWVSELKVKTGRQQVAWQVPVGNQYFLTMNNTCGHYQDNVAPYFIAHPSSLVAAGLVAVMFGKGNGCQTTYIDWGTHDIGGPLGDGITNNGGSPTTDLAGFCNTCNTHTSTNADDDGGYLRIFVGQYYVQSAFPGAPTNVVATGGDGSAGLSWTAPSSSGGAPITSYVVTAYDGCTIQGSQTVSGSPPATTLTFAGLTNGTAYTFKVAAVNSNGTGPQSAASNVVVPSGTAPTWVTACSTQQYTLTGNNGSTWQDLDTSNLSVSFTPAASSMAVLSGNADLWTANAGYNQDLGLTVSGGLYPSTGGQPEAWKESGGFAGTFSPNAASVQTVIPVLSGVSYTVKLQWKANKADAGSIFAGAGPISGAFSPTRLTVQLLPSANVFSKAYTGQPCYSGNDGVTWTDMDATNLSLGFTPPAGSWIALVSGNADLFASTAGYNQDIGIALSGGAYPTVAGQPEAWKESGGFAGTYSPNAALVQAALPVSGGTTYTAKLQWKTNKGSAGSIHSGAGPISGRYSPTTLTVVLVPAPTSVATQTQQYSLANSDGSSWQAVDLTNLKLNLAPGVNSSYQITANADLWTSVAGYNQDLGVMVSGGAYGSGTLVAWKESGGFAGTFSPNAAFVSTDLHLQAGNSYTVWVVWKANRAAQSANAIFAGAGPVNGHFSPMTLTAVLLSQP